jgi:hypothetical protein
VTICGHEKRVDCTTTLVCNKPPGHDGPHGVRECCQRRAPHVVCLRPYVTWPDRHEVVEQAPRATDGWRKPHVRRKYQTLGMWKAERGL